MDKPYPSVEGVLDLWIRQGRIDHTHKDALLMEITDDVRNLNLQVRAKDETIQKLCEALVVRRAMEPKHSDPEHDCPECELVAEIIHSERTDKRNGGGSNE